MEKYEINKSLELFKTTLDGLKNALNLDALTKRLLLLNEAMGKPDFWSDAKEAKKINREATQLEYKITTYNKLEGEYNEILDWIDLSDENQEIDDLVPNLINNLKDKLREFEIEILLSGQYDVKNAIVELHPGAGGTESADWCEMLYRMYTRYCAIKSYKIEILDYQEAEEAGLKSVTFLVKGAYAYGHLKSERGVHRLVRISPFDSNARRHTSFASCEVIPESDDDVTIDIKDDDLKIDSYRSSGAGGQSVNTTDSAIRITHLPSGIVVTCQNERSQGKNRETALKILKSKLLQLELKNKENEIKELKGDQKEIGWGNQIRSYVFQPYQLVKDHRTNYEVGNVTSVMDGDLDGFINAYLKAEGNNE